MKKFIVNPFMILVIVIILSGCKDTDDKNRVIVEFEGGSLTAMDLDAHHERLKKSRHFRKKHDQLTPEVIFDHALNMQMIITKGLDENLHLDPKIRAELHEFMSELFINIMKHHIIPVINKDDFTEEELKAFYDKHIDNYTNKAVLSVNMIKTESSELAEEIIEKINTGQLDFSVAAADYSTDEQSKDRGGNIGNRKLARFQKSWQPVISALEVGKVSGPHKIGDEYYIFELTHKTEPVQQSFEDRKAFIKNDLLSQKYKAAWQDLYAQLKKQYKVEINQENLDAFIEERSK